jgi:hypothetical protein
MRAILLTQFNRISASNILHFMPPRAMQMPSRRLREAAAGDARLRSGAEQQRDIFAGSSEAPRCPLSADE